MTGFGKVSPGDPTDLIKSARYHNAIIDLLSDHGQLEASEPFSNPLDRETSVVRVKNTAGVDVPRGGVLGLGGVVVDADENEGHFLDADPCFQGVKPTTDSHSVRFVVALGPIAQGRIGPCVASGWVPAKVDIESTTHIAAKLINNDVDKLASSDDGSIPLVIAQIAKGVKWAMVKVPATHSAATHVGLARVSEISSGLTEGSSHVSWVTTGRAWLYNSWGVNTEQHVTASRCEISPTVVSSISGEHDENVSYSAGDQVTSGGNVYEATTAGSGAFSLDNWDWLEPYRPAYGESETYTAGDKVTVDGLEYTASTDSADPAGTWDSSDWEISSDPRIRVHSVHKGIELTADTWVTVYGTSPVVCGGGPYFAAYANPDDYLRMMDGWTTSQMQALYHSAGDEGLRWGGAQCEE